MEIKEMLERLWEVGYQEEYLLSLDPEDIIDLYREEFC